MLCLAIDGFRRIIISYVTMATKKDIIIYEEAYVQNTPSYVRSIHFFSSLFLLSL